MKSGNFIKNSPGSYHIKNVNIEGNYQYNLVGKNILVCLDQYGIVKIQANPLSDIVFVRREYCENHSKWLNFIVNDNKVYSTFNAPSLNRPINGYINFYSNKAKYVLEFENFISETLIYVDNNKQTVVMELSITSKKDNNNFDVYGAIYPFMNYPDASSWDPPTWYARVSTSIYDDNLCFYHRLMNANGIKEKRRNIGIYFSSDCLVGGEYFFERFIGHGNFYYPDAVYKNENLQPLAHFNTRFDNLNKNNSICGFQSVYSGKYTFTLNKNESKTIKQVISLLDNKNGNKPTQKEFLEPLNYFNNNVKETILKNSEEYFNNLFTNNQIKTPNKNFDYYLNYFIPLQLDWVKMLDRGWPTGMKGTRDLANDYMGILYLNPTACKKELLHLFSLLKLNGWFPRQIGENKNSKHDMRNYVDGGVFALEFLYEYLVYTRDFKILNEKVDFLDSDNETSLLDHVFKIFDYYANNIGSLNLIKIYEGDWFDGLNKAGLKGIGQSVTVSCQFIMAYKYFKEVFNYLKIDGILKYESIAIKMEKSLRDNAFNECGYFNGLYNDDEKWIFSNNDPDGKKRIYCVPNAFSIFSGVCKKENYSLIVSNLLALKSSDGYKLFKPAFTKEILNVGRVASGDVVVGLNGNSTVYNHGSQGFLLRALLSIHKEKEALEVLNYLLPYNQKYHNEKLTKSAPYAITNCYQDVYPYKHRTTFLFLTGTVAIAYRSIINYMFGIRPVIDGLIVDPCLDESLLPCSINYKFNDKNITVNYKKGLKREVRANEQKISVRKDILLDKDVYFIPIDKINENLIIDVCL